MVQDFYQSQKMAKWNKQQFLYDFAYQTICWQKWFVLLPKLFRTIERKNCSSDQEKLLKVKAEGWEFAKLLRSLEQFIQTMKGQKNVW